MRAQHAALRQYCRGLEQKLHYILYQWLPLHMERFRPLLGVANTHRNGQRVGAFQLLNLIGRRVDMQQTSLYTSLDYLNQ